MAIISSSHSPGTLKFYMDFTQSLPKLFFFPDGNVQPIELLLMLFHSLVISFGLTAPTVSSKWSYLRWGAHTFEMHIHHVYLFLSIHTYT